MEALSCLVGSVFGPVMVEALSTKSGQVEEVEKGACLR